ncbi:MAG: flagellar biosynthesis protein FlhB [Chloroflexota bacterium]|nr:MAG: flagellar biosynthesis protein FlhB [Chloroflexota bacterium]
MPAQERTESATPRRREEVRRRGQSARSADLNAAMALLAGVLFLRWSGAGIVTWSIDLLRESLTRLDQPDITIEVAVSAGAALAIGTLTVLAPIFAVMIITGVVANLAQVGFLFTMQPLQPDFSRINPFQGFQRLFSKRSLVELAKSIAKLLVVGFVVWRVLESRVVEIVTLPLLPWQVGIGAATSIVLDLATWASAVLFVLAAADYAYQRVAFEQQIRMSRDEVRQEMKQTEGNPIIRQRVRQLQRAVAQRRMMQAVPRADVVITNPTHVAVALEYRSNTMKAPRVVAKGEGLIAERIKQIALEHGVPMMENRPLARALLKACDIGDEIPAAMYAVVAELLAFVYRAKGGALRPVGA